MAHGQNRSEKRQSAGWLYRRAKASLDSAKSSSSCRTVFDHLLDASEKVGKASMQHRAATPAHGRNDGKGKPSGDRKMRNAIDKLADDIDKTARLYRDGGCIVGGSGTVSPGLSGLRGRARKRKKTSGRR